MGSVLKIFTAAFAMFLIVLSGCKMQIRGGRSTDKETTGPFGSVSLISPSASTQWAGGTSQSITWDSSSLTGTTQVTLSYSTNGGATWTPIAGPIADTGSYSWTVPSINGSSIQVQVLLNNSVAGTHSLVSTGTFTIDSIVPTVAITSPSAGSIINTNNQAAFTVIGNCSENGRNVVLAAGAVNNSGGCIGGAFSIALNLTSLSDGAVTVTADHSDAAGNAATQDSRGFTKDATRPAVPTVSATNPVTSSSTNTNVALNNLSITGDTGAVKWCVIEQLSTDAAPSEPAVNDACFVSTRPTTHTLAGRGLRRLYVYTLDNNDNRSLTAATDDLDFPLPTVIELTGPGSIPQSGCSDALRVVFKDSYGMDSFFSSATTVTLSGGSTLYSDAGCLAANNITSISVGSGQVQSAKFYFKSATLGALTLQAAAFSTSDTLSTSVDPVYEISSGGGNFWINDGRVTCLISAGSAQCSGSGYRLGNNSRLNVNYSAMVQVTGITASATNISVGAAHTCAVVDGAAQCWGRNGNGQLGINSTTDATLAGFVNGLGQGVRKISANTNYTTPFSCAVVGESARCWGSNSAGQIGDGTSGNNRLVPTQVTGLTSGVTDIDTGYDFACAIHDGALKCWGSLCSSLNGSNQCVWTNNTTPVTVGGLTSGVTRLALGQATVCVVHNGELKCLWDGERGLLGNGAGVDAIVPISVPGLSANIESIAIARGSDGLHACAVQSGGMKCWGDNFRGQLGIATEGDGYGPTTPTYFATGVKSVATGAATTCATLTDTSFRCFGQNINGEFGSGDGRVNTVPVTAPDLAGATQVSLGDYRHCLIDASNKLKCWGYIHSWMYRNSPEELEPSLATHVSVGTGWFPFSTCEVHDGGVKCFGAWGSIVPTTYTIPAGSGATLVANGYAHRCAIVSGGVQCLGDDQYGQLGNGAGSPPDALTPVTAISTAAGVTALAAGDNHSCAIDSAGALLCWGENSTGTIGDGSTSNRTSPVTIYPNNTTSVAAGKNHTCAVRSGAAYCWGYNYHGQLGDGIGINSTVPVAVAGLGSGVASVFARGDTSCALMSSGALKCWGINNFGQLGNGLYGQGQYSNAVVDVIGMNTGVSKVSIGVYSICAEKSGVWKCWGSNQLSSALGNGEKIFFEDTAQPILAGAPAELALTGPATSTAGVCSAAFTVTLKDSAGNTTNAFTNLNVTLHEPGTGSFYDSAGCGGAPVSQITITTGNNTGTFYYMAPSAQQVGIQARTGSTTYRLIPAGIRHDAL